MNLRHLPTTVKEMKALGLSELDVILISGDAYVDHPAFGHAVIGRVLESQGLRVGIVAQPNWQDDLRDFKKLGVPKLFFGVTAGAMDSMVSHYTAGKRKRSDDAYTPGNKSGFRPDRAVITYSNILKDLFPDVPVILGGVEASLRRFTHYDYWSDSLMPSILLDSRADLLVYGMGERPIAEIANLMQKGVPFSSIKTIPQTAFIQERHLDIPRNKNWADLVIASHHDCLNSKKTFMDTFSQIEKESNRIEQRRLIQPVDGKVLVVNPAFSPSTEREVDLAYDLPYTRLPHPRYKARGDIHAFEMIKFSINSHRGCFGGCSFCSIAAHQGKHVVSRSRTSILKEVEQIVEMEEFKGYLSDLGGPSANMYKMEAKDLKLCQKCSRASCIYPHHCENINLDHSSLIEIYQTVNKHAKVKKLFIGSGVRYDLALNDGKYLQQLIVNHVSGRLKVAPEHTCDEVLKYMGKPSFKYFVRFKELFEKISKASGLKQQLVPYFISSHPGCTLSHMASLADDTKKLGYQLDQIQDFTPTPMTTASAMYYTRKDFDQKEIFVAKSTEEKANQRKFFFWYKPENKNWVRNNLARLGLKNIKLF